jgi:hypothetical protein
MAERGSGRPNVTPINAQMPGRRRHGSGEFCSSMMAATSARRKDLPASVLGCTEGSRQTFIAANHGPPQSPCQPVGFMLATLLPLVLATGVYATSPTQTKGQACTQHADCSEGR